MELTLLEISLRFEKDTGSDSIKTIEEKYSQTENGTYRCCWPGCQFTRRNPESMWRHIHFSKTHREDLRNFGEKPLELEEVIRKYANPRSEVDEPQTP